MERSSVSPMLLGILYTVIIVLVGSLILALLLEWTSLPESQVPMAMFLVNGIALLYGGFIAGRRSEARGWFSGAVSGLGYALVMLIIGFLAFDMNLSLEAILFLVGAILLGTLGGALGINTNR